jgi:hypothetical protein
MVKKAARARQLELSFMVGLFMTDHLIRVHKVFEGDLIAALVLGTVANRGLQRYYEDIASRAPEGFDALVESGEHLKHLRHCNAFSVSSATGIPRETVRRKVKWLEQKGWLTVGTRGELTVAVGISKEFAKFDGETVERFLDLAGRCLEVADRQLAPR